MKPKTTITTPIINNDRPTPARPPKTTRVGAFMVRFTESDVALVLEALRIASSALTQHARDHDVLIGTNAAEMCRTWSERMRRLRRRLENV